MTDTTLAPARPPLTLLSEEEQLFRDAVTALAAEEVRPRVLDMEAAKQIDPALTRQFFELGLMGIEVPEQYGGADGSAMMIVLAVEEISKVDASAAIQVDVQNTLVEYPIATYGTEAQKARFLTRLTRDAVGAYALSEPGSGSDAFGLATRAERVDGGYRLTGSKAWITNGAEAEVFVVFASEDPSAGYKGITAFILEKSGWRGSRSGSARTSSGSGRRVRRRCTSINVFVPDANLLGQPGKGVQDCDRHAERRAHRDWGADDRCGGRERLRAATRVPERAQAVWEVARGVSGDPVSGWRRPRRSWRRRGSWFITRRGLRMRGATLRTKGRWRSCTRRRSRNG